MFYKHCSNILFEIVRSSNPNKFPSKMKRNSFTYFGRISRKKSLHLLQYEDFECRNAYIENPSFRLSKHIPPQCQKWDSSPVYRFVIIHRSVCTVSAHCAQISWKIDTRVLFRLKINIDQMQVSNILLNLNMCIRTHVECERVPFRHNLFYG